MARCPVVLEELMILMVMRQEVDHLVVSLGVHVGVHLGVEDLVLVIQRFLEVL